MATGRNDYQSCKTVAQDAQDIVVLERGELADIIQSEDGKISTNTFAMFASSATLLLMLVLALTYSSPFDSYGNVELKKHHDTQTEDAIFTISSPDFYIGDEMDNKFVCSDLRTDDDEAPGYNPTIQWSNAPSDTAEFLLLMTTTYGDDETKYDWIYYGISAALGGIPADVSNENGLCDSTYGSCGGTSPDRPEYYYKVNEI